MGDQKTNINDIVDSLVDTVSEIVKYRSGIAMGLEPPEGHEMYNKDEQLFLLDLVKPLFKTAQETKHVEAKSSADVVQLLARGQISVDEAASILSIIKTRLDVEEKEMQIGLKKTLLGMMGGKE